MSWYMRCSIVLCLLMFYCHWITLKLYSYCQYPLGHTLLVVIANVGLLHIGTDL